MSSGINKYDILLVIIIGIEIFGLYLGPLFPARMLSILLSPMVLYNIINKKIYLPQYIRWFFITWIVVGILSLVWSCDMIMGVKHILYHFCNIISFFLVYICALKANKPLQSIIMGWVLLFLFSVPIAFYEFNTGNHLSTTLLEDDISITDVMGIKIQRLFAAVTFGNLNTYNVILCYCLTYISVSLFVYKHKWEHIFLWGLILLVVYIIMMNASRGAFLCLGAILFMLIVYLLKQKSISKFFVIGIICVAIGVIWINIDVFMGQIIGKLATSSLVEDDSRMEIWSLGFKALCNTLGFGVGIGGGQTALLSLDSRIIAAMHNAYFELLLEYGVLPFLLFIYMSYKIYIGLYKSKLIYAKFLGILLIVISFPLFIINSGYLVFTSFWIYLSCAFSIYQISRRSKFTIQCN